MTRDTDEFSLIDEPDDIDDPAAEQAAFARWWAQLPDFIKPAYPFDLPADRMAFARRVFTLVGAPRLCPEAACRRAGECGGGDGPPCLRADRERLLHVLFLWWMRIYEDLSDEEYAASLRAKRSPYAPPDDAPAKTPPTRGSRRRRR
jgi:hypothetical protein